MVLAHVRWSTCFLGYCSVCVTIFVKQHVEHPLNRSHTEKSESSHLCITTFILTTKTHTLPSDLSKQHLQIYIRQSVTIFSVNVYISVHCLLNLSSQQSESCVRHPLSIEVIQLASELENRAQKKAQSTRGSGWRGDDGCVLKIAFHWRSGLKQG